MIGLVKLLLLLVGFTLPLYVIRCSNFSACQEFSPVPFTFLEVIVILTFLSWLFWKFKEVSSGNDSYKKILERLKTPLTLPIGFFLLSSFASVWISTDTLGALGIFKAYFLEGFLIYIVALDFLLITKQIRFFLLVIVISGLWVSLVAIGQYVSGSSPLTQSDFEVRGRVSTVYTSANAVGLLLGPILMTTLAWFLWEFEKSKKNSPIILVLLSVLTIGIFLSGSRGAFLGVSLAVAFTLLYQVLSKRIFDKKILPKLLIGLFCVLTLPNLLVFFSPEKLNFLNQPTLSSRLCLWEGASNLLKDRPFVGGGLDDFRETHDPYRTCTMELNQYPHNIILNFWTQIGLVGLVSFLSIAFWIVYKLIENGDSLSVGIAGIFWYIFGHGLLDVPFFKNDLAIQFWLILAFGTFLVVRKKRKKSRFLS